MSMLAAMDRANDAVMRVHGRPALVCDGAGGVQITGVLTRDSDEDGRGGRDRHPGYTLKVKTTDLVGVTVVGGTRIEVDGYQYKATNTPRDGVYGLSEIGMQRVATCPV